MILAIAAVAGSVTWWVLSERASVEGLRRWSDIGFLDEYAEEIGIVMGRARSEGPEPERFARRVDGPGPGIETLHVSGSAYSKDGAEIVLRLRRERYEATSWFGGGTVPYEISACYRWVFGPSHEGPARLRSCPDVPVIDLGPPPVVPELPAGFGEVLSERLAPFADDVDPAVVDVADSVRSAYADAVDDALATPGVEPEEILNEDEILAGNEWVVENDGVIGVAVGQGFECVVARIGPGEVQVWHPRRISLQPGEIGCSAHFATVRTDW